MSNTKEQPNQQRPNKSANNRAPVTPNPLPVTRNRHPLPVTRYLLLVTTHLLLLTAHSTAQTIRYVKPNASGSGMSWSDASGSIQAMIDASTCGDQIWIAGGTYIINQTLEMKEGVNVYGGFQGVENSVYARPQSDLNGNGTVDPWEYTYTTGLDGRGIDQTFRQPKEFRLETVWDGIVIIDNSVITVAGTGLLTNGKIKGSILRGSAGTVEPVYFDYGGNPLTNAQWNAQRHDYIARQQAATTPQSGQSGQPGQTSLKALDGGGVSFGYERTLDSDAIREEWLQKGGPAKYMNLGAGYTHTSMKIDMAGMGEMEYKGNGVGAKLQVNRVNLKPPEYKRTLSTWSSFLIGGSFSFDYTSSEVNIPASTIDTGYGTVTMPAQNHSMNMSMISLSVPLGYTLALGFFQNEAKWKGIAIDLSYTPTLVIVMMEEADAQSQFNFTGFSFGFNFTNFDSTLEKIAPKAKLRIAGMILPQTEKTPFIFNINIGLTKYF